MNHSRFPVRPVGLRTFAALAFFALIKTTTAAPSPAIPKAVALKAAPFPLENVRLLDGPFRDAMLRDKAYLLQLDPDQLLHNFRVTAGLSSSVEPLGGWEKPNCELRGHTVGHYLSALALMYASTGEEALKQRTECVVAELAKCQEALPAQGYNKGYLSAYPESFFDRVDRHEKVWAPYYTLHKIMVGLFDVYQHCGNQQALDVLRRMADWLKLRVDRLSHEQMQVALSNEHGGMNEVLANLYAVTHNPEHLKLAQAFNHEAVFAPLARGEDKLDGLHANTQIPKITGAAREYELTGDKQMRKIATFFWERVALHRSYVIGGDSDHEHFFAVTNFPEYLSPATAETCNTYNMLKLTRHLFEWEPSAQTMDFYERGLYNQILASQDPETGMFCYFVPMISGHFKTYSTPTNSFWCCVGTGMENHAKYGDTIYFHSADVLYVNLFIPSQLNWKEKGLVVRQETKFPDESKTRLTIECARPTKLALKIRHPSWAQDGITILVNGKAQKIKSTPGSYLTLKRDWHNGDRVEVDLPMRLHTESLPGDSNTVAVLYGPIVLAAELGTDGLPANGQQAEEQGAFAKMPRPAAPVLNAKKPEEVVSLFSRQGTGPLTFETQGLIRSQNVSLIPLYRLHHERYAIYWKLRQYRAMDD